MSVHEIHIVSPELPYCVPGTPSNRQAAAVGDVAAEQGGQGARIKSGRSITCPQIHNVSPDPNATQKRTIPNTTLGGTAVYDAPGYPAQGGTNPAPVYGGQVRQDVPRALPRPAPQVAAATRLCGAASIAFPQNPKLKMGYSVCLISETVPISTRAPTAAVEAQLRSADLDKFNKGWPTIVRFQGYRNAWNQYTTTEIWVRPNGRLTNQVIHYRVNSPMSLKQQ